MATVIDSVSIKGLRLTHFNQLLNYILEVKEDGWYYGRKSYFDCRHKELKDWVAGIIVMVEDDDIIIPNRERLDTLESSAHQ